MSAAGEGAGTTTFNSETMRALPKVELHRHLEGSLPPAFFLEMAKEFSIDLPAADADGLGRAITMVDQAPGFLPFLEKFEMLRTFYVDPEIVKRATREAIRLAAEDNIRYLELRYNPLHFATQMAFRIEDVIEWVTEARDAAVAEYALQVELIATVNRNDPVQESLPTVEAAIAGAGQHFAGIDIAGDENHGNLVRFAGIFRKARTAGLGITIHAGEVGPAANVRDAIRLLGADRIGHGIRVLEDPEVVKLAKEAGVVFEVCPTSNLRTGAVESIETHPIAEMARAELAVALCTDDPVTCGTTLTDECLLVGNALGLEKGDFLELSLTALQGAFRPKDERTELAAMFEDEFASVGE